MASQKSRRRFLGDCAKYGGACCALLAWNSQLKAGAVPKERKHQQGKPIDLKQLSYCSIPCAQVCELYKATREDNAELKKLIYEKWEWKKKFGNEYEAEKVFCYTCKPQDRPNKPGMATCGVRNCAIANGMESCVQCKSLAVCKQEFWKSNPETLEFAKKVQARYSTQPGAMIKDIKSKP